MLNVRPFGVILAPIMLGTFTLKKIMLVAHVVLRVVHLIKRFEI